MRKLCLWEIRVTAKRTAESCWGTWVRDWKRLVSVEKSKSSGSILIGTGLVMIPPSDFVSLNPLRVLQIVFQIQITSTVIHFLSRICFKCLLYANYYNNCEKDKKSFLHSIYHKCEIKYTIWFIQQALYVLYIVIISL
jgi:hypothetical protein